MAGNAGRQPSRGRFALVLLALATLTGGCAGATSPSGRVGGVEWAVTDMKRTAESGLIRWTYVIRFTETAGHTVTFTKVRITQVPGSAHPDAYFGGSTEQVIAVTVGARSEHKMSWTQTMTVPSSLLVGSSMTRAALTKRFEFLGVDDAGTAVNIPVLVNFDPR
jgi:hypothetical protein